MSVKPDELKNVPHERWMHRIKKDSSHNKLTKKVRETLSRFLEEGVIETTENCALMKPPPHFVVSFMSLMPLLDIKPYDLDNGNLILTGVTPEKISVILENRYRYDKEYVWGWAGKDELRQLGFQSYLSLAFDDLVRFNDTIQQHRSKLKFSSSKAFDRSGRTYKISVKAYDNFASSDSKEKIEHIENIFDKALRRVREVAPDVSVGNSQGIKNSKFDMYVDEIPSGLLNYFKLLGLEHFVIYANKNNYDLFTAEGSLRLLDDIEPLIKYNT